MFTVDATAYTANEAAQAKSDAEKMGIITPGWHNFTITKLEAVEDGKPVQVFGPKTRIAGEATVFDGPFKGRKLWFSWGGMWDQQPATEGLLKQRRITIAAWENLQDGILGIGQRGQPADLLSKAFAGKVKTEKQSPEDIAKGYEPRSQFVSGNAFKPYDSNLATMTSGATSGGATTSPTTGGAATAAPGATSAPIAGAGAATATPAATTAAPAGVTAPPA